ncbi:MAG: HEPN domain-containing protein [Anaerolineae bacterium]|nr:HEPN domain-containing protein [Anaerolineae bacterium]
MLEKAARFIASAVLLIENDDYDSAVSRLYYAMFFAQKRCC